jgi:hypothetical protein
MKFLFGFSLGAMIPIRLKVQRRKATFWSPMMPITSLFSGISIRTWSGSPPKSMSDISMLLISRMMAGPSITQFSYVLPSMMTPSPTSSARRTVRRAIPRSLAQFIQRWDKRE